MRASANGHLETVRFLVEQGGANVNAAMPKVGLSALIFASASGHLETVRFLVEHGGAAVNAAEEHDPTALPMACLMQRLEIVRFLLEQGGANVNQTYLDMTPLMFAAKKGHLDIVHLLLQHGADRQLLCGGMTAHAFAKDHPLVQAALA